MAYVEMLSVSSAGHLHNLIDYVQQDNKTQSKELVHCSGCQMETIYNDFSLVRKLHQKQGGVLSHQIIQSFQKGETDVETAFKLSCEYAEKMLPGFQYTVCTHVDQEHIHSHIIVNSVNQITGRKFENNLDNLALYRRESDLLCKKYGLSIIDKKSGRVGLDKTTFEMAKKGKSWKVKLSNDLDAALNTCKSKSEFNAFMQDRNYDVFWTNKNITVKVGDYKIRVDTLARQFGGKYCKAEIEKVFGIEPEQGYEKREVFTKAGNADRAQERFNNHEKEFVERMTNEGTAPVMKELYNNFNKSQLSSILRLQGRILRCRSISSFVVYSIALMIKMLRKGNRRAYAAWKRNKYKKVPNKQQKEAANYRIGNITKRNLLNMPGETATIKVPVENLYLFNTFNIYFSGYLTKDGAAVVSFKSENERLVSDELGIEISRFKNAHEINSERERSQRIKAISKAENRELHRLNLTADELKVLDDNNIVYSHYRNKDLYSTLVFKDELQGVCAVLGKDYATIARQAKRQENNRAYVDLKRTAQLNDDKIVYRVVDETGRDKLVGSDLQHACFDSEKQAGKYNIAMLEKDINKYQDIMKTQRTPPTQRRT